jgi:hypothetical protein
MADAMITLTNLPYEKQVRILDEMSISSDEVPIEINGQMYKINFEVMDLINGLHEELTKYRKIVGFGVSRNKED